MHDTAKTKTQLIDELDSLRRRVAALEASRADRTNVEGPPTAESMLEVIEKMADGLILMDVEGRYVLVNRAIEKMSGYRRDELLGRHYEEFLPKGTKGEETERLDRTIKTAYEQGITPPMEFTLVGKDGREFRIASTASLVGEDGGEPRGLVTTYRDITDQTRMETNLRESEERFRALFEGSLDAICLVDPVSGKILNANPVSSELLSKPLEDIIGMHFSEFHPPSIQESVQEIFREHVEDEVRRQPIETTLITADGKEVPAELLAQIIQVDGVPVLMGTFRDITQRKRAEETLRRSEERYRLLVQNSSDIVVTIDGDGSISYTSPAVERILGYSPEELIGQARPDISHLEDAKEMLDLLPRCMNNSGEPVAAQFRLRHKDGSWKHLESVARNCLDHPAIHAIILNTRDITERVALEEKLRQREERYRFIAQNSPDIICIINPDSSFRYVSPAAEQILGYSPEEVIEHMGFDHVHPEDRASALAKYARLVEDPNYLFNIRYRLRRKDGSYRYVEAVGRNGLANPATRAIFLNVRDITDRVLAERTLARSQHNYRFLYDNLRDASATVSLEGTILEFNTTFQEMLGYDNEEILRFSSKDITPPKWHAMEEEILREQVMKRGYSDTYEKEYVRKDGSVVPVELRTHLLRDSEGRAVGRWTIIRDITERKRMEEELLRAEKMESLGILSGGIAHDFNNILTAILTNISMAQMYGDLDKDIEKMLADAEKASLRGKGLTQQLLTFAKGGEPIKKIFSIRSLVQETTDFVLSGSNVRCDHDFPNGLWPVEADEGQIGQVIQNVTLNADQAMPGGAVIRVHAENINISEENPLPLGPGPHVKISIADQGLGMPEEHLQKIFDPFFTTKQKGSGLGLSTSFSILRRHSGALQVESRLGGGTTVHIYLPAVPEGAAKGDTQRDASYRGEERVLLIDDDDTLRRSIGQALRRLGYEVECAEEGKEGIRIYEEARAAGRPIHAVVMDLTIPGGMGGKNASQEILRIDPNAKLIVSSGYSTDPVMSDFRAHGFLAVISKPYRIEALGETLRQVLTEKRSQ